MLGWENLALAIKDKFEGFRKKKKNKGKFECGKKKERVRKKEYVEKVGKYLNFYAKQSHHTHIYFFNMTMILLLYKNA